MDDSSVDISSRDRRIGRAVNNVLKNYTVTPQSDIDGFRVFAITGGTIAYAVHVHPEWWDDPTCTCPDFKDGAQHTAGYCKHIIAVLIGQPTLTCQLLEVFL